MGFFFRNQWVHFCNTLHLPAVPITIIEHLKVVIKAPGQQKISSLIVRVEVQVLNMGNNRQAA